MTQLICQIVHSRTEFTSVMQQLEHFLGSQPEYPLCCSLDWLDAWLQHYSMGEDTLWMQLHYASDQLVAFYPLYLKKTPLGTELRFVGTGEPEIAEVCSEFQDFVITKGFEQSSLALFSASLKPMTSIKKIIFDNVLANAISLHWLQQHPPKNWHYHQQYHGKRFVLPILAEQHQQIDALRQSTLRRYARRFFEQTAIEMDVCTEHKDIMLFFADLTRLHQQQWQRRGKPGAFSTEVFQQFHQALAAQLLEREQLLLFRIHLHGKCIAAYYGFYHQECLYYYQSGIEPTPGLQNIGVGMHLLAMSHARNKGCSHYDLMRGNPTGYKKNYSNQTQQVYTAEATTAILSTLRTWKKQLKQICHKILP
ncbi:GNAT family N-acetyltransferase [Alkalimonas mucilaginosa]|uniref:GNAT family N-acetyltransferase n=1 Tax=Alkalimonas mucilaginosa TaxID=3057676 RepID=A0ABU7JCX2_9GAMM|nr:GNAT family N-acetyltransferase [Alkalimonas sp. MEB004]MEE2022898.1 GNAT family N-acetyltransferase [Alkalimonas sp. MEB004]